MSYDYTTYLSPFTWRYSSAKMRHVWSEVHKRRLWRQLWVTLAKTQAEFGLISTEQVQDLQAHQKQIDMDRALAIEAEIHHDLMAELKTFAEQAHLGGGILHLGATSADIEDNADALRIREALDIILSQLRELLSAFARQVEAWAEVPAMAFTHLQPAEPTTLGYRLAQYAQDLYNDWQELSGLREGFRGKGFKGAVGTGAAFGELLGTDQLAVFEARLSERLGLPFFSITSQVYPRKQEYRVVSALAGLGGTLYKFSFDLRVLSSPPIGELHEPFREGQVGSSTMPFKRNPINAEKVDSLARSLARLPGLAWDNAAHSLLERTLDDSANRRTLLPEAFLMVDELLAVTTKLVNGLQVDQPALARNLSRYGPFAGTERVLVALGKAGADRQAMHERLRHHALLAWEAVGAGEENPLLELVSEDEEFLGYLTAAQLRELMKIEGYVGDASQRAKELAKTIRETIGE